MKVKVRDVINCNSELAEVCASSMKASSAFKFRKVLKFLDENIKIFNEARQSLIDKYKLADENGNIIVPDEIKDEVDKEFSDLLEEELEFTVDNITIEDFNGVEISPIKLDKLVWMIK